MSGKLLRTIRLDPSDSFAFERAAEPGEWAVPGTFMFFGTDVSALKGKPRVAFRSGWLGLDSFGWSTIAVVVPATAEERADAVRGLASGSSQSMAHPTCRRRWPRRTTRSASPKAAPTIRSRRWWCCTGRSTRTAASASSSAR